MSTTTARKPAARTKPAATKSQSAQKAAASKEQKPAPAKAKREPKLEAKTLVEALTTGQAMLLKVRANGTKRSLPYLAVGTEGRAQAEAVAKMREDGQTVDAIAQALNVSTATARRFIINLALAHAVEAGEHDGDWIPGTAEIVVHRVVAKQPKA
ncbi:hypothetical protein [Nocardioides marmotae]|uniref:hypothetical protein n=1 Tax=Nocardioides marmotae TaxID=2663857 RepID=UPI0012B55592|nr:hypothetical protein [Nocardioides marmotae]MBC9733107.1 hypothetical protein [Nocardioides marmotae]MTB84221.1 hypothetical protein [Nocardioides marmotae]